MAREVCSIYITTCAYKHCSLAVESHGASTHEVNVLVTWITLTSERPVRQARIPLMPPHKNPIARYCIAPT